MALVGLYVRGETLVFTCLPLSRFQLSDCNICGHADQHAPLLS